jgi:hypothetical protein
VWIAPDNKRTARVLGMLEHLAGGEEGVEI